jgi:hypothetical protein
VFNQDIRFTRQFWTSLVMKLNTKLKFNSEEYQEIDGRIEGINRALEDTLRVNVFLLQKDSESYLPLLDFALSRCSACVVGKGGTTGVLDHGTPERWERRPEESQQWLNGNGGRKPCSASTQRLEIAEFPVTRPTREAVRP